MAWAKRTTRRAQLTERERQAVLAQEPRCRLCGAPATEVDHIVPVARRPDLVRTRANLQALCVACHRGKTARIDSKPVAPRRREPEAHPGLLIDATGGGSDLFEVRSRLDAVDPFSRCVQNLGPGGGAWSFAQPRSGGAC
jgi:hypothetical protein